MCIRFQLTQLIQTNGWYDAFPTVFDYINIRTKLVDDFKHHYSIVKLYRNLVRDVRETYGASVTSPLFGYYVQGFGASRKFVSIDDTKEDALSIMDFNVLMFDSEHNNIDVKFGLDKLTTRFSSYDGMLLIFTDTNISRRFLLINH